MKLVQLGLLTVTLALAGCTSIAGLGGGSGYACKAPPGVICDSVSGVYANALADRLPGRRGPVAPPASMQTAPATGPARPGVAALAPPVPAQGLPVSSMRSSARVLRLWVKPWEDADGDLIDQSYVYVQIDAGQWLIEHAQRQIREAHAPVRPPPRLPNTGPASPEKATEPGAPRPSAAARTAPLPHSVDNLD